MTLSRDILDTTTTRTIKRNARTKSWRAWAKHKLSLLKGQKNTQPFCRCDEVERESGEKILKIWIIGKKQSGADPKRLESYWRNRLVWWKICNQREIERYEKEIKNLLSLGGKKESGSQRLFSWKIYKQWKSKGGGLKPPQQEYKTERRAQWQGKER